MKNPPSAKGGSASGGNPPFLKEAGLENFVPMRNSMFSMEGLKLNSQRLISLNLAKKIILSLIIVFLFDFFLFPLPTLANEAMASSDNSENQIISRHSREGGNPEFVQYTTVLAPRVKPEDDKDIISQLGQEEELPIVHLPQSADKAVKKSGIYVITAYNSEVGQTDGSPCITANGFNVCEYGVEDTIAANFLPFGAKVKMPNLFGDKVFVVRDRMNSRYSSRLDVWMINKTDAKKFGVKLAKIEVLEP
ncbi:3D domain-containing protein [Candidatus Falkowbacteria bacterium]|nr:3D domain-containing protein [Candidatus Falkowbacteria bacterium]